MGAPEIQASPTAEGTRVVVRIDSGDRALPELITELHAAGHRVLAAELARPTLDDVFLGLTGRSLREEGQDSDVPTPETAGAIR